MPTEGDLQLTTGLEPRDKSQKENSYALGSALSRQQGTSHETVPYKETIWVGLSEKLCRI